MCLHSYIYIYSVVLLVVVLLLLVAVAVVVQISRLSSNSILRHFICCDFAKLNFLERPTVLGIVDFLLESTMSYD